MKVLLQEVSAPITVVVITLSGRQETHETLVSPGLWYGRYRRGAWRYYDRIGGAWGRLLYHERANDGAHEARS